LLVGRVSRVLDPQRLIGCASFVIAATPPTSRFS
jgi:hypothetical protein